MKNVLAKLVLVSFALLSCACQKSETSNTPSQEPVSSSEPVESSQTPLSSEPATTSSQASAYVENQLSTSNGLVIKFNKTGAKIDSVELGGKKIAENGFTVGRCANRIAGAKFTLNGTEYNVSKNDGNNSLHGGRGSGGNSWQGPFATSNWDKVSQTANTIEYKIHSADGNNGYPGNMDMNVKYTLSDDGKLDIEYTATSDKDTLCNPTNHLFMSLNGSTSYSGIKLWIDADNYTPRSGNLPTGQIVSVAGTQFDYRSEKTFDSSKSYDDNLVLNATEYAKVASLSSAKYKVEVFTDRPGLQLYKENNGNICLESQMFPNAINVQAFEDPILRAGETFYSKTAYCFSKLS